MNSITDKIFYFSTRPKFWVGFIKTQLLYKLFFGHIGKGTLIIDPELISNPSCISIGNNTIIHPNARILCYKQFKNQNFHPSLKIHNNIKIQQGVHITCADKIEIENGVTIAQYVAIFDIDHTYEDLSKPIHSQPIAVKSITIGENCFIGKGSVIMKGTKIGKNCIIGANAVVKGVFPDYSVIAGVPARIIKRYDTKINKYV